MPCIFSLSPKETLPPPLENWLTSFPKPAERQGRSHHYVIQFRDRTCKGARVATSSRRAKPGRRKKEEQRGELKRVEGAERGRGEEDGNFSQRSVSFWSREQNRAAALRPSSPGAPITLTTRATCASINPPAFFLYDLKQNSTSAEVATGHNKYISSNFSS